MAPPCVRCSRLRRGEVVEVAARGHRGHLEARGDFLNGQFAAGAQQIQDFALAAADVLGFHAVASSGVGRVAAIACSMRAMMKSTTAGVLMSGILVSTTGGQSAL